MSIATLGTRLAKVEDQLGEAEDGECSFKGHTIILSYRQGEPEPSIPEDAPTCSRCGGVHVLYLEEVVAGSRADVEALKARDAKDTVA
jgi:hypothetical protein